MDAAQNPSPPQTLALPPPCPEQHPPPFPLVACLAPLVASAVIWALTSSLLALAFAALSPIVAVASVADGRRHARRSRIRDRREHARAMADLEERMRGAHDGERARMLAQHPAPAQLLGRVARARRWNADSSAFSRVRVGVGSVPSGLILSGEPRSDEERVAVENAATLPDAPALIDPAGGLAVVGSPTLARALGRAVLVQLTSAHRPDRLEIVEVPPDGWSWALGLPHAREARRAPVARILLRLTGAEGCESRDATIRFAAAIEEIDQPARIVIEVISAAIAQVTCAGGTDQLNVQPDLLSEAQATQFAAEAAAQALAGGFAGASAVLPRTVSLAELKAADSIGSDDAARRRTVLPVAVGITSEGPLVLDLASDGPHAVVAGTTGSGKSEFLVTWITALAASRRPDELNVLLVDFKGGSAFAVLAELPHCVGLITDLAHGEANRALTSLRAEVRYRERILAELGARDIVEAGGALPRLVIVVDEFAAMLDAFPELHAVFVDIAARGRSLGVHAILCTQRPAGVVRDALLANCALRVSLRVHDGIDSVAVVGSDAAARIPATTPGRCVVARDGKRTLAQLATVDAESIRAVVKAQPAADLRPPWLPPLPACIPLPSVARRGAIVLGIQDLPDEQRQEPVTTTLEGHLSVLGVHGSGKSALIDTIATQWRGGVLAPCRNAEAFWDALLVAEAGCARRTALQSRILLALDDLDAMLARLPQEYQDAAAERLLRIARTGSAAGVTLLATAHRVTPALRPVFALCAEQLLLAQQNVQDHLLAGASSELYLDRARPGLGVWRGRRIQTALSTSPGKDAEAESREQVPDFDFPPGCTALVTRFAASRASDLLARSGLEVIELGREGTAALASDALAASDKGRYDAVDNVSDCGSDELRTVVVGDPHAWQSVWPVFSALRSRGTVVYDGCTVADVRGLQHDRELPPLIDGDDRVWFARSGSNLARARWTLSSELRSTSDPRPDGAVA